MDHYDQFEFIQEVKGGKNHVNISMNVEKEVEEFQHSFVITPSYQKSEM